MSMSSFRRASRAYRTKKKLPDPVDRPVTQNAPLLIDFSDGVLAVEFPDDVDGSGVAFFVEVDDGKLQTLSPEPTILETSPSRPG